MPGRLSPPPSPNECERNALPRTIPSPMTRSDRLRRFLEAYWLRPENAFWMALRSDVLSRCRMNHRSIDLCCGDGLFSFLHGGGILDPAHDVFHSVGDIDRVQTDNADMFDHASNIAQPPIQRPATDTFDIGTDLKPALLAKARCLDCYGDLIEHDSNQPLPVEDGAFQTVYCNAAYWVTNIHGFLQELSRITATTGRVILHVKLDAMRRYTLQAHRDLLGDRFLQIIDRGRSKTWPSLTNRSTWENRFKTAGLKVEEATPFITKTHAHIWDIGLRPIAPLLVKMTRALTPKTRADIKREWVELFHEILTPICDSSFELTRPDEPAEIQYVLSTSTNP